MRYGIFILVFILIGLIVGSAYFYFSYEKPAVEEQKEFFSNLSIYATENEINNVRTGYIIYLNNMFYKKGETLEDFPILIKVPSNESILVRQFNLEDQSFYSDYFYINNGFANEIYRVKLNLIDSSELNTDVKKISDYSYKISLSTRKLFQNLSYCLEWSESILFIKSNSTQIRQPQNYSSFDKCFNNGFNVSNSNQTDIYLDYKLFHSVNDKDYIKIRFFDGMNIAQDKEIIINNINNI